MTEIKLDTTGYVGGQERWANDRSWVIRPFNCLWSDLNPFTQGYVEALFASRHLERDEDQPVTLGFSDLAPETLARIMEDCARFLESYPTTDKGAAGGARFCIARRCAEAGSAFPPQTPYVGDDGRVYLREDV